MIKINMLQNYDLKGVTIIEGFPGVGLVGPMAISYIIDKLGMKYIGYIDSDGFPPIVSIHESKPMPPVRVYYSEKNKVVTIFAEFPIPIELVHELSNNIYDFIKEKQIERIISIGGIPGKNPEDETAYVIASNADLVKDAEKYGLNPVIEGVSTGVSALLLQRSSITNTQDTNILIPVDPNIIDPKYAELAIKSINKLLKLNIDTSELEKEAKDVEAKVRDLIKKGKETQDAHKRLTSEGPSMYG